MWNIIIQCWFECHLLLQFSNRYVDKILEMVAVMRHASQGDDDIYEREQETLINKLVTENKVTNVVLFELIF